MHGHMAAPLLVDPGWSHYWRRDGPMPLANLTSRWSHAAGERQKPEPDDEQHLRRVLHGVLGGHQPQPPAADRRGWYSVPVQRAVLRVEGCAFTDIIRQDRQIAQLRTLVDHLRT